MATDTPGARLFSIGHSNHPLDQFLALLAAHRIEVLVDFRSHPSSRYASHFDAPSLSKALGEVGVRYLYMGKELGGRPEGEEFYDAEGHALYWRVAEAPFFLAGIARLEKGAQKYRVAVMCSEEDPTSCHRRLLIGRVLERRGVVLEHIRGDGRIETEAELRGGCKDRAGDHRQLALFGEPEVAAWRSTRSLLHRGRQPSSSAR